MDELRQSLDRVAQSTATTTARTVENTAAEQRSADTKVASSARVGAAIDDEAAAREKLIQSLERKLRADKVEIDDSVLLERAMKRVENASDGVAAATLREESAAGRVFAARERLAAAYEAGSRATDDLSDAEERLNRLHNLGALGAGQLNEAYAKVSQARERLGKANAVYAELEAKLTDQVVKHHDAEVQIVNAEQAREIAERALGERLAEAVPAEQRLAAARRDVASASGLIGGAEADISRARTDSNRATRELEAAERTLQVARRSGEPINIAAAEEKVAAAREKSEGAVGRLRAAESELVRVRRDHESASTRLRDTERDLGDAFDNNGRRGSAFGRILGGITGGLGSMASSALSTSSALSDRLEGSLSGVTGSVGSFASSLAGAGGQMALFATIAGAVTYAVGAIGAAILALPAVMFAGAASIGVFALAFSGFSDAVGSTDTPADLKKQQEALAKLSPEARKTAEAINALKPAFSGLKKEVQDKFFEGMADEVRKVNGLVPILRKGLVDTAGSLNVLIRSLADVALSTDGIEKIRLAFVGVNQMIGILTPGLTSLFRAFLNLASVGPIYQSLGAIFNDLFQKTANFLNEMVRTGEAVRAVDALRSALSHVEDAFFTILRGAINFFTNATPGFNNLIDQVGRIAGQALPGLGTAFGTAMDAAGNFLKAIPQSTIDNIVAAFQRLSDALLRLSQNPAAQEAVRGIVDTIAGGIDDVSRFIDTINGIARAFETVIYWIAKADQFLGTTTKYEDDLIARHEGLGQAAQTAGQQTAAATQQMASSFAPLPEAATRAGTGMAAGIQAGVDRGAEAARGGGQKISEGITGPLGQVPGQVAASLDRGAEAARGGGQKIADGITAPLAPVPNSVAVHTNIGPPIGKNLGEAVEIARGQGQSIKQGLLDPLSDVAPQTAAAVAPVTPAIQNGLGGAAGAATTAGQQAYQGWTAPVMQIAPSTQSAFGDAAERVRGGGGLAAQQATIIGQSIKTNTVSPLATIPTEAAAALAPLSPAITNALRAAVGAVGPGLAPVGPAITAALTVGTTAFNTAGVNWQTAMTQACASVVRAAQTGLNGLAAQAVTPAMNRAVDAIRAGGDQAVNVVRDIGVRIINTFNQINLYNAGANIMRTLANGMISQLALITQVAQQAAANIRNQFPASPAKDGPLSGRGDTLFAGQTVAGRLIDGLLSRLGAVRAASQQVAAAAAITAPGPTVDSSPNPPGLVGGVPIPRGKSSGSQISIDWAAWLARIREALAAALARYQSATPSTNPRPGSGTGSSSSGGGYGTPRPYAPLPRGQRPVVGGPRIKNELTAQDFEAAMDRALNRQLGAAKLKIVDDGRDGLATIVNRQNRSKGRRI